MSLASSLIRRGAPALLLIVIVSFHFISNFRYATEQPAPGWSRPAALTGAPYGGGMSPALVDGGGALVFTLAKGGIAFTALTPQGEVVRTGALPLEAGTYHSVQALGGKQVDLFWRSGEGGTGTVYHAVVSKTGELTREPARVAESIRGYVARQTDGGPVVLAWGTSGMRLYRPSGAGWEPVGVAKAPEGTFSSMDGQVLQDGRVFSVVHMDRGDKRHTLFAVWGTLKDGFQRVSTAWDFAIKTNTGQVQPLAVGADATHGYAFYHVDTSERGDRKTTLFMATAPLEPDTPWDNVALGPAGGLGERVSGGQLYNPTVFPGQSENLQVAMLTPTVSRFNRNLALVVTTFRAGQRGAVERVYHGENAVRPVVARAGDDRLLTFATMGADDVQDLYAVSSAPAFVQSQNRVTLADLTRTLVDTVFDLVATAYGLINGAVWILPMVGLVGVLHLVALSWTERNPAPVFWVGVAIAAPLQIYVALRVFSAEIYREYMPAWMALPLVPLALYMAVSGCMLLWVWWQKRPARYTGAFTPLAWWGFGTLLLTAALFGPFVRRG